MVEVECCRQARSGKHELFSTRVRPGPMSKCSLFPVEPRFSAARLKPPITSSTIHQAEKR